MEVSQGKCKSKRKSKKTKLDDDVTTAITQLRSRLLGEGIKEVVTCSSSEGDNVCQESFAGPESEADQLGHFLGQIMNLNNRMTPQTEYEYNVFHLGMCSFLCVSVLVIVYLNGLVS